MTKKELVAKARKFLLSCSEKKFEFPTNTSTQLYRFEELENTTLFSLELHNNQVILVSRAESLKEYEADDTDPLKEFDNEEIVEILAIAGI